MSLALAERRHWAEPRVGFDMAVSSSWASVAHWAAILLLPPLLGGCETVAITALGVGASAGVMHTASSVQYRTFTVPPGRVKRAVLAAFDRMDIEVQGEEERGQIDVITATGANRAIEVELERMSRGTTQLRAVAKHNLFVHDSATAREIVEQTEAALAAEPRTRRAGRMAAQTPTAAALR